MCALCNGAHLAWSAEAADGRGAFEPTGEPTEAALRALAEKIGAPGVPAADREAPERASDWWAARTPNPNPNPQPNPNPNHRGWNSCWHLPPPNPYPNPNPNPTPTPTQAPTPQPCPTQEIGSTQCTIFDHEQESSDL